MSLKLRLLLAGCLVLAGFVLLTAFALHRAVYRHAEKAEEDKLRGLVYGLLGATDIDKDGRLRVNIFELPDEELTRPESGLYALFYDREGHEIWRSPSYLKIAETRTTAIPAVGEWRLLGPQQTQSYFELGFGFSWLVETWEGSRAHSYFIVVAKDAADFQNRLAEFRTTLWLWLLIAAILLMLVLGGVLIWGLRPLRQLSAELRAIENGAQAALSSGYPRELEPLAENLNTLLQHERRQQSRYRHALDDLAHSLKTPLAVMHGVLDATPLPSPEQLRMREYLERMNEIVGYQLQRAATAGKQGLRKAIALRPLVEKIVNALRKVYHNSLIEIRIDISDHLQLRADDGDLLELLGNLLDNACKYGNGEVAIHAYNKSAVTYIIIADNGAGFPAGKTEILLQRGMRADSRREGQGIGLAVVQEIVSAYGGHLQFGQATLGGAQVTVSLP